MATHRVVVADLRTGQIVLNEDVDLADLGSNDLDTRQNLPFYNAMPQQEWEGRAAAGLAAPQVCPYDCDGCNSEIRI